MNIYAYIYIYTYIHTHKTILFTKEYGIKGRELEKGECAMNSIFYVTHGRKRQRD